MKHIFILIAVFFSSIISLSAQQFSLPADGKWYLVAKIGGMHSEFEYTYKHTTAHKPSLISGRIQFINSQSFSIQEHHSMGYANWLQPQFALLNLGGESQIWVKAAIGADVGIFKVSSFLAGSLELGSVNDDNLNDNGGILTVYNIIRDNTHTYIGNLNVIDGNVGIGTDLPSEKLSVNGKIRAKEIKVEATNWPDYVFDEGYNVGTLETLEGYIKASKHLPDIPTAREVKENGVELGEMNKLLLKKIEELTLYIIELKKESVDQQKQLDQLKKR
ncbi:hypothetical protein OQX63_17545 [Pedobacter sp. PF22-3]|uniref:hypothetical protein n=1 Tax=Pedobacter sp. PF22-3 TaxID=2994467 RepID=UPI002245B535|nr:hypothetical protein [Pedobacter sp. PF22-3]MCX2495299.1 hypothetical protein [Pedobacter sp. PF22-3]